MYFAAPADWATRTFVGGGSYPSANMQSVYSASPSQLDRQNTRRKNLIPLQIYSRCILQPKLTGAARILVGGVLFLCKDTIAVFCSPNQLGHVWFEKLSWNISSDVLTSTHRCIPAYTGASRNHFVYAAGTSGSVKVQYATIVPLCFYLITWKILTNIHKNCLNSALVYNFQNSCTKKR